MAELNFNPGDQVRLRLALKEIEGRVLETSDKSILLLKLNSGYNIGIPKENILAGRVLKKYKEEDAREEVRQDKKLPAIGLIITGGTIASKASQATGGVKPITDVNEFLSFYPELMKIVNVKKIDVPFKIFSENMSSEHWIKIAEAIKPMLDDPEIKGVIVSHGTDTLHYTSAALSFFLKNLNKPVVLTYSQRSIDRASSDASLNLQCAARMAISDCAEVMLVGHANSEDEYCYALRGTKVKKLHSSRRDAFKPINTVSIAKVFPDKIEFLSKYKARNNGKVELDVGFSDKTALIKFYPGQSPDILDFYALKYKGIVIEGTGLGHVAGSDSLNSWIPALKKHIKNGLVVCMTAQTVFGRVDPYVYSTALELLDAGVIFLEDMLSETALVKLGFVLGHYGWKANAREKMLENLAGELNDRLEFQK
jgi:glutamyl-tRNA(Gln) amidotransferase subunit D